MPQTLATANAMLLFGATGDLARRMLIPSLYDLHAESLLPDTLTLLFTARSELDDADVRKLVLESVEQSMADDQRAADAIESFLARVRYVALDVKETRSFSRIADALGTHQVLQPAIFLSTAPELFEPTIMGLQSAGLTGDGARIGLEKPLGSDLASATNINDAVRCAFDESCIFRIDHYLGKETVQNLLALRFGNMLFEPLWNSTCIDHVQITVSETVGLEQRADFYDGTGALRDMVQNHMLQLLSLVAMEAPAQSDSTSIRDEKVKVLRSLRPIGKDGIDRQVVFGQYAGGNISGQAVDSYTGELGHPSATETFVALKAHVDNWRWKGVPFYLRTGKRLPTRYSEIVVQFRPVPHSIFDERWSPLKANRLVIRLQPEEYVRLDVMSKVPGLDRGGVKLRSVPLDLSLTNAFAGRRRIAYERLFLDLIEGDSTLFVRRDEVEAQWQWIDRIRQAWTAIDQPLKTYAAGTWGPSASVALTERDGVSWHE